MMSASQAATTVREQKSEADWKAQLGDNRDIRHRSPPPPKRLGAFTTLAPDGNTAMVTTAATTGEHPAREPSPQVGAGTGDTQMGAGTAWANADALERRHSLSAYQVGVLEFIFCQCTGHNCGCHLVNQSRIDLMKLGWFGVCGANISTSNKYLNRCKFCMQWRQEQEEQKLPEDQKSTIWTDYHIVPPELYGLSDESKAFLMQHFSAEELQWRNQVRYVLRGWKPVAFGKKGADIEMAGERPKWANDALLSLDECLPPASLDVSPKKQTKLAPDWTWWHQDHLSMEVSLQQVVTGQDHHSLNTVKGSKRNQVKAAMIFGSKQILGKGDHMVMVEVVRRVERLGTRAGLMGNGPLLPGCKTRAVDHPTMRTNGP